MTKETLLFQRLLDAQQLHVGDPEFADMELVLRAKEELSAALAKATDGN